MRNVTLRALGFGAAGSAIAVVTNIFATIASLLPGELPIARFWFFQLLSLLGVATVLCAGAFAGFATVGARDARSTATLALEPLAGVPVFLVSSSLLLRIGLAGAVMVAIGMSALIAAVGGGALRGENAHG
jgi:hypothetical protein